MAEESKILSVLKALSDETRLRIIRILGREPLHVSEILDVLRMGQSRISRHLRILAEAGILESRRDGARIYYGFSDEARSGGQMARILNAIETGNSLAGVDAFTRDDLAHLDQVLLSRENEALEHFQKYGVSQDGRLAGLVDSAFYRKKILSMVPAGGVVADAGCGTGELLKLLAQKAKRTIGVDQSENVLEKARLSCPGTDFRIGRVEHLPLRDGETDTFIFSMVLHHLPDPVPALLEAHRVLKKEGTLVIAELAQHNHEEMRSRFADFWLGFEKTRLNEFLERAGFEMESSSAGKGEGTLGCLFLRARRVEAKTASISRLKSAKEISKAAAAELK